MSEPVKSILARGDRVTATRLGNAISALHASDTLMPLRLVSIFLLVAREEGLTVGEIAKRCGVWNTVASRCLSDLGAVDRHGAPGLGLVILAQKVYGDRRERRAYVTERGVNIIRQMHAAVTEIRPRRRF